jgi:hypothetical protein
MMADSHKNRETSGVCRLQYLPQGRLGLRMNEYQKMKRYNKHKGQSAGVLGIRIFQKKKKKKKTEPP